MGRERHKGTHGLHVRGFKKRVVKTLKRYGVLRRKTVGDKAKGCKKKDD